MQMVVGGIGDAFAIASYPGSRSELPTTVFPSDADLHRFATANGVVELCRECGADPRPDDAPDVSMPASRDEALHSMAEATQHADLALAVLEGRDAPSGGDPSADSSSRARFQSTLVGYTKTIESLGNADDPESLAAFKEETRPLVLRQIAFRRGDLNRWRNGGATYRAIAAGAVTLHLLRGIYLITTAAHASDARSLPLPSPDRIDEIIAQLGIRSWLHEVDSAEPS
jgi:hypothetical protein